jgi:enterochelin esterase-like enzyme
MVHRLKPFINANYPTRTDARYTMVGGSSAGGISAFMLVWEHPDAFSRAICMSPAFMAPAGSGMTFDYVATVRATVQPPKSVYFYTDIGGVGLEEQLRPGVEAMLGALKDKGFQEGRDFAFVRDPAAEHNEAAWGKRLARALMLVTHGPTSKP